MCSYSNSMKFIQLVIFDSSLIEVSLEFVKKYSIFLKLVDQFQKFFLLWWQLTQTSRAKNFLSILFGLCFQRICCTAVIEYRKLSYIDVLANLILTGCAIFFKKSLTWKVNSSFRVLLFAFDSPLAWRKMVTNESYKSQLKLSLLSIIL